MKPLLRLLYIVVILSVAVANFDNSYAQETDNALLNITKIDPSAFPEVKITIYGENLGSDLADLPIVILQDRVERSIIDSQMIESGVQIAFVLDPALDLNGTGNTGDARWFEIASAASNLINSRIMSPQTDWFAAFAPSAENGKFHPLTEWQRDHQAVVNTLYQYTPPQEAEITSLTDVIQASIDRFGDIILPADVQRSIIVFSDGVTLLDGAVVNRIVEQANGLNLRIFTIMTSEESAVARRNLERLSIATGGQFFVYNSVDDLGSLWQSIATQRLQRQLTYTIDKAQPIDLEVRGTLSDGQVVSAIERFPTISAQPVQVEIVAPTSNLNVERTGASSDTPLAELVPAQLQVQLSFEWPDGRPRPLSRVEYILDDVVRLQEQEPFDQYLFPIADLGAGAYTLRVNVIDSLGLIGQAEPVTVQLQVNRPAGTGEVAASTASSSSSSSAAAAADGSTTSDTTSDAASTDAESSTLASSDTAAAETSNAADSADTQSTAIVSQESTSTESAVAGENAGGVAESGGQGMNLFGIQLPETVEILGVTFLVNGVTLLIALFPLIFLLAFLIYWLTQRSSTPAEQNYGFYDYEQNGYYYSFEQNEDLQITQPQIGAINIEDELTEPVQVPAFYNNAPAYLIYVSGGNHLPKKLPIETNEPVRIGRKKSFCEQVLDDKRVSRLHAVVSFENGEFHIRDEGSSGGTFVNRHKLGTVDVQKLEHNDIVNFNEVEYRFEITTELAEENEDAVRSPVTYS